MKYLRMILMVLAGGLFVHFPLLQQSYAQAAPQINDLAANPSGLSQAVAPFRGGPFTLTVNGTGFLPGAVVSIDTAALATTFVSPTQLTAQVTTAVLAYAGANRGVTVANPGTVASNTVNIKVIERGDINGSRTVNIGDALVCALNVGGLNKPPLPASSGDLNLNGSVNIGDCLAIALFAGRLNTNLAVPAITSVSPSVAITGTPLTITGTGLAPDATTGNTIVQFTAVNNSVVRVVPSAASPTSLSVIVPAEAISGLLEVYRPDSAIGGAEFPLEVSGSISSLVLTGVNPSTSVAAGTSLTLSGMGFDATPANDLVLFKSASGSTAGTVTSASATNLMVTVPSIAVCGPVTVTVAGQTSNAHTVMVAGTSCDLQLTGLWGGGAGTDTLVLEGAGFDAGTPANNIVHFQGFSGNTVSSPVLAAGGTQLHVSIPASATGGDVTVTVGSVTSNAVTYVPATIVGDERPTVTAVATDGSAAEASADSGTFTFTRTEPISAPLTVQYSVDGTAINGSDYGPVLTGSVTIPAGQTSAALTIIPVADNLLENAETIVLTVQPGEGYKVGSQDSDTITLADDPAIVNLSVIDTNASEASGVPGTLTFTRSGGNIASALTVNYALGGTATNGVDYALITNSITIPANSSSAMLSVVPLADNIVESAETVSLTIESNSSYSLGTAITGTVTINDDPVTVEVAATDRDALETGLDPGVFTFTRTGGNLAAPLQVFFSRSGTAQEDIDYLNLGAGFVTIPANELSATLTVTPKTDAVAESDETVILTITANPIYVIGAATATITIHDAATGSIVSLSAIDSAASESGPVSGLFRFKRSGTTTSDVTVSYSIGGTATNGADYSSIGNTIVIPAGQASADLTITPIVDALSEPLETVTITLIDTTDYDVAAPASATVTIADAGSVCGPEGGALGNGTTHCGAITNAGETDTWTFTAAAGDRVGIHIGEVVDNNDFRPWIRLIAPNGTTLVSTSGLGAAVIEASASVAGTYQVLVASFDSGFDGTGTYRLTMTHTPGPITVSAGDEGGPLTNGAIHSGEIVRGDVDVWTFNATAGDRVDVHIGKITDTGGFVPWIRIWAPNGTTQGAGSAYGADAAALEFAAPVSGTYLVLVSSADSGYDGTGTYRLTMTASPGPITVSPGDEGGPLVNGAIHLGEIVQGDVDVWTFTATSGDRIGVHVGKTGETDDFHPWIRIWAPNGSTLGSGSGYGADAAALELVAPVTGTYLVLVASFDSGYDGEGTYRLTMTHTGAPITVSAGDEGGPLTNGAIHTGEIVQGDVDVWTFNATAGDRVAVHIGKVTDTGGFVPWIRIWAPNGSTLGAGSAYGADAAALEFVAPVTGTYLVLVASFDSGYDGEGTYRLTMTHTGAPITVSAGDEGGPLTNGAIHTGEIVQGDVDVWTFNATTGDRVGVHIGKVTDTGGFVPWIRIWAPNGSTLGSGSAYGADAAALEFVAPVSGTYLVLVASFDSGYDGEGTYRLTMTHTGAPITVSAGDEGGPLTNGAMHSGEIVQGDVDVWTFNATTGDRVGVHIGKVTDTGGFVPWIRIWAPNGSTLGSGSAYGAAAAALEFVAPVSGTYLVLVSSFDSGYDGTGTYQLTMTQTPGPVSVSAGDQGGPITLGALHSGEIVPGDVDVWTVSAVAGEHISIQISETAETDDFRPWIRLWAPNGASLGNASGTLTATISNVVAPVSGTYLILVSSFDSGYNGAGSYQLTVTKP